MIPAESIQVYILPIQQLPDFFSKLFEGKFGLEKPRNEKIVEKHLIPFFNHVKEDLFTVIEFPYVDKMYRDTYYHYYASKLRLLERETIRISFFSKELSPDEFRNAGTFHDLTKHYKGFLVLRPTFPKIIGRSAFSPDILRNVQIECCKAPIRATANSIKFTVQAFPHASQDSQSITCAETTIWSLMEYFGNKYPEYKPVLPSEIMRILQKFSYKRQVPSDGLTLEQIAFAVRELGFGTMIYSSSRAEFKSVVSSFIESGIPIIGVIKKDGIAHAVNIIGKEKANMADIPTNGSFKEFGNGMRVLDFDDINHRYVFIDDNHPPYQTAAIDNPVEYYTDTRWHGCSLKAIVVPLYRKIYLEPIRAKKNFQIILKNKVLGIQDTNPRVIRTFLASSRSYKEYIAFNEKLNPGVREFILSLPMTKFIWVQEISNVEAFTTDEINGLLLQDATEPTEHPDETNLTGIPVFFGYIENRFFSLLDNETKQISTFASQFKRYRGNLG